MQHSELHTMLKDLYPNDNGRRPTLLAVGWGVDSAAVVQLTSIDFDVHYATTVAEALRWLRGNMKADVVMLNVNGGYDIYVATAAVRLYTSGPIVLLFSGEATVNPAFAVDAGADDWLPASIHPHEFTARIYARIRRHHVSQRPFSVFGHPEKLAGQVSVKQPRPLS